MPESSKSGTILLAGASRGLGLGLAAAYLQRGWKVVATARAPDPAGGLAKLQGAHPDALRVETLDVADPASVQALAGRLQSGALNILFVVAGSNAHSNSPINEIPPADIARELLTNATAPIALADTLQPYLAPGATVAFMTSIMGSIASNAGGGMELYRASKAALNMLASCYALRHKNAPVLLLHPGWVRTDMGGANAPVDIVTSVSGLIDVIGKHAHMPGLAYLDYRGAKLPW